VPAEVEVWPTSVVFEAGERLVLEIATRDDPGLDPLLHTHAEDRVQGGTVTIYTGGKRATHLLLPIIPPR
jgi:predicted acyl esterase